LEAGGETEETSRAALGDEDEVGSVQTRKSVHFDDSPQAGTDQALTMFQLNSEDDDEDDEDFEGQSDSTTSDEDDSDEDENGDSSESANGSSSSLSDVSTSSSEESSDEESSASEPEELSAKLPQSKSNVPPGSGLNATHERNKRRRDLKRLNGLKEAGLLPRNANFDDLRDWVASNPGRRGPRVDHPAISESETPVEDASRSAEQQEQAEAARSESKRQAAAKTKSAAELHRRRQELIAAIASGGVDVTPATQLKNPPAPPAGNFSAVDTLKERRRTSLDAITPYNPRNESMELDSAASTQLSKPIENSVNDNSSITAANTSTSDILSQETAPEPPAKRARLDVAGSRRMLFGSLGLRNPRTKADEEKTRAKITENAKPPGKKKASVPAKDTLPEQPQEPEDPDFWKSKIVLTAVECCEEGVELSPPPFPFVQRWHGQKQNQYQSHSGAKDKKRKRSNKKFYKDEYEDSYEWYDGTAGQDEADVTLNYDDAEENPVESQLYHDLEDAAASKGDLADDLPSLPANMSELSDLRLADVKPGIVIAFRQLEVSQATNWAPAISDWRTAAVEECEGENLTVRLAKRDRPRKVIRYDEEGNRLYDKFEMEGYDGEDEEEDDGIRDIPFSDLIEPKIVQEPLNVPKANEDTAPGAEQPGAVDDVQNIPTSSTWDGIQGDTPPEVNVLDQPGDSTIHEQTLGDEQVALVETSA